MIWTKPVFEILESEEHGPGRVAELMGNPAICHAKFYDVPEKRWIEIKEHIAEKARIATMSDDELWMDRFKREIHSRPRFYGHRM